MRTLVAMTRLGREYKAREQMLAHGTLKALTAASSDEADVSGACLSVVSELVKHREFSMPLGDAGFVKLLVSWPTAGMQLGSVTALGQLVAHEEKAMEAAIADGAVMTCVGLLEATESNEVRAAAGLTLSSLTYGQAEKCVALEAGVMRTCAGMLREEDEGLQVAAAAIAMSMCNGTRNEDGTNACKTTAVKEGLVKALAPLLEPEYALELTSEMDDSNSTALPVYVMKAMSSLADAPKGRKRPRQSACSSWRRSQSRRSRSSKNVSSRSSGSRGCRGKRGGERPGEGVVLCVLVGPTWVLSLAVCVSLIRDCGVELSKHILPHATGRRANKPGRHYGALRAP